MDEKIALEKRYGRRSPLPTYEAKYRSQPQASRDASRYRTRNSVLVYISLVVAIFITIIYVIPVALQATSPSQLQPTQDYGSLSQANRTLVPLEAHIMSKCPDARDCLEDLVVPAMEQVVDKVDFRLSYIGKVDDDDKIQCMHGSTECLGNMLSLCANELFPHDVKISLGFSTCLISSYEEIPNRSLVQSCALEHGIEFEALNACISEEGKGLDLLEASVERSRKADVTKSCTVRVGGELWCIRDGGEWKDCEGGHEVKDLVKHVEERYKLHSTPRLG